MSNDNFIHFQLFALVEFQRADSRCFMHRSWKIGLEGLTLSQDVGTNLHQKTLVRQAPLQNLVVGCLAAFSIAFMEIWRGNAIPRLSVEGLLIGWKGFSALDEPTKAAICLVSIHFFIRMRKHFSGFIRESLWRQWKRNTDLSPPVLEYHDVFYFNWLVGSWISVSRLLKDSVSRSWLTALKYIIKIW